MPPSNRAFARRVVSPDRSRGVTRTRGRDESLEDPLSRRMVMGSGRSGGRGGPLTLFGRDISTPETTEEPMIGERSPDVKSSLIGGLHEAMSSEAVDDPGAHMVDTAQRNTRSTTASASRRALVTASNPQGVVLGRSSSAASGVAPEDTAAPVSPTKRMPTRGPIRLLGDD